MRIDAGRHVVIVRGKQIQLPLKEFQLLKVLLRNADRVLTRMQLIDRVWGAGYAGDATTLDVHLKRLRAKIEPDPDTHGTSSPSGGLATSSNPHPDSCGVALGIGSRCVWVTKPQERAGGQARRGLRP